MQESGIGPVLTDARRQRGKTIEEASRETRIRPEYLHALEGERFEELIGEVYVRAFLRSYSTYLGLDASRLLSIYSRQFGGAREAPGGPQRASRRTRRRRRASEPGVFRRHPSRVAVVAVAALVIVVLGVATALSRSTAPPRTASPGGPRAIPALPPTVTVGVRALSTVAVTVRLDGGPPRTYTMREDESRSFEAAGRIDVSVDQGGVTAVTVNGVSIGAPGDRSAPWSASYRPGDFRSSPSGASP